MLNANACVVCVCVWEWENADVKKTLQLLIPTPSLFNHQHKMQATNKIHGGIMGLTSTAEINYQLNL